MLFQNKMWLEMILLCSLFHVVLSAQAHPQVTTPSGDLQGATTHLAASGIAIDVYRGIPYAEPPVGEY